MSLPNSPHASTPRSRLSSHNQSSKPIRFMRNSHKLSTSFDRIEKKTIKGSPFQQNYIKISKKEEEQQKTDLMNKRAIFETPKSKQTEFFKEEEFLSDQRPFIVHHSQKFLSHYSPLNEVNEKLNQKISSFQSNRRQTSFLQKTAKRQKKISLKEETFQIDWKEQNEKLKQELKRKQQQIQKLNSLVKDKQRLIQKANEKIQIMKTSLFKKEMIISETDKEIEKYQKQNNDLSKQLEQFMMQSRIITEKEYELGSEDTRMQQSQFFTNRTQQLQQEIYEQNIYIYELRKALKSIEIKERTMRMIYENQIKQIQRSHAQRYEEVLKSLRQLKHRERCLCTKKRSVRDLNLSFSPE